ncbi:MAG: hypothetical protein R2771_05335 [Saprospiraceae bacterium]
MVWLPSEQILFGGNEIRNYKGWVGNIGDANINQWPKTAKKIKKNYGNAIVVIPGHGKFGGSELIDYTIDLFTVPTNKPDKKNIEINDIFQDKLKSVFYINSESDTFQDDNRILINATVIVHDNTKSIEIISPQIIINTSNEKIESEEGRVKIYDLQTHIPKLRTDVNYKKLIVYKYDNNIVGYVVVLKEIESTNL